MDLLISFLVAAGITAGLFFALFYYGLRDLRGLFPKQSGESAPSDVLVITPLNGTDTH